MCPSSLGRSLAAVFLVKLIFFDSAAQPAPATAARPRDVRLDAAAAAPRIDGRLDDALWQRGPVHDAFVQYRPVDREPAPPAYRTTLQVVIADDAITFGIRAFDPSPMDIRAPLTRRDQVRRDQDFVSVILDPVGTRRSA